MAPRIDAPRALAAWSGEVIAGPRNSGAEAVTVVRRVVLAALAVSWLFGCSPKANTPREFDVRGIPGRPKMAFGAADSLAEVSLQLDRGLLQRDVVRNWGDPERPDLESEIADVRVECFPVVAKAVSSKAGATTYTLVATATFTGDVHDSLAFSQEILKATGRGSFPYKSGLIFEALGLTGVVLERFQADVEVHMGGGESTAKWEGLQAPEMDRIKYVRARWEY